MTFLDTYTREFNDDDNPRAAALEAYIRRNQQKKTNTQSLRNASIGTYNGPPIYDDDAFSSF